MKEIILTRGKVALVDDEDFDYLNQWKWNAGNDSKTDDYYARAYARGGKNRKLLIMHRLLMKTPKDMQVDHIDHNGLNNQKSNLRNCTRIQNLYNKKPRGISKYLGVHRNGNTFSAKIKIDSKQFYLGSNKEEVRMAKRYDMAAIHFHGEFANLNFK